MQAEDRNGGGGDTLQRVRLFKSDDVSLGPGTRKAGWTQQLDTLEESTSPPDWLDQFTSPDCENVIRGLDKAVSLVSGSKPKRKQ